MARDLETNRKLLKFVLLSIVTFGIYTIIFYSSISEDINKIASGHDGQKTMHYCLLFFLIGPLTLGIGVLVWFHKVSKRIGTELERRDIGQEFSAETFWLWNVLGSLIIIGPLVYTHKLCKAMNELVESYNDQAVSGWHQ